MYQPAIPSPQLSPELCKAAWELILPAIQAAAADKTINKLAGTIVVLNPDYDEMVDSHEPMFIFSAQVDKTHQQAVKFTEIATLKALLTGRKLRLPLPSSLIQQQYPYLYKTGDTKWGGSTVMPGGIVIAFSGVQAVYDEMISEWMASAIRALSRNEMNREDGVMASESAIIGGLS